MENEPFLFQWPGKKRAVEEASLPGGGRLVLDEKRSFGPASSENWIIEGENLEVLKALRGELAGRVKCTYIDPPYNTGKGLFSYSDNFSEKKGNGRAADGHAAWLSMMMPRLLVARELMADDGVIFISIDDNEAHHLRLLCDEVFGENNFGGQVVWQTATDNNRGQIATEHEYVTCYFKNRAAQGHWEIPSEKGLLIEEKYRELLARLGNDPRAIERELRGWLRANAAQLAGVAHYSYVDEQGVFYPGNSANTRPGGYDYDIFHPKTGLACGKPAHGYRFTKETFEKADAAGDVLWPADEAGIPKIKKRLATVTERLKSTYYEDNRATTAQLRALFDGVKVFTNPKSVNLLKHLFKFVLRDGDLVLDFFAGSGSTGQAIAELSQETGQRLRFVLVQLPEPVNQKGEARRAGFETISEITIERNRRAIEKIMGRDKVAAGNALGFKVFTLEH